MPLVRPEIKIQDYYCTSGMRALNRKECCTTAGVSAKIGPGKFEHPAVF
jgi:hypothetical protein